MKTKCRREQLRKDSRITPALGNNSFAEACYNFLTSEDAKASYSKLSKEAARTWMPMGYTLYHESAVDFECIPVKVPWKTAQWGKLYDTYNVVAEKDGDVGSCTIRERVCRCGPCLNQDYGNCQCLEYAPAPSSIQLVPGHVRNASQFRDALRSAADRVLQSRTDAMAQSAAAGVNAVFRHDESEEDCQKHKLPLQYYIVRLIGPARKVTSDKETDVWGFEHVKGDHVLDGHFYVVDGTWTGDDRRFYLLGDDACDVHKTVTLDVHFLLHIGFEMPVESREQKKARRGKGNRQCYLLPDPLYDCIQDKIEPQ